MLMSDDGDSNDSGFHLLLGCFDRELRMYCIVIRLSFHFLMSCSKSKAVEFRECDGWIGTFHPDAKP